MGTLGQYEARADSPQVWEESAGEERRNRSMCEIISSHASICRHEVVLIDQDFAYKWPILFFYLDQRPENRSLIQHYIMRLRYQLSVVSHECSGRARLQNTIHAIDAQLAIMQLRIEGKEIRPAIESHAYHERGSFLFAIVKICSITLFLSIFFHSISRGLYAWECLIWYQGTMIY